ncbi:hypothetical protein WN51_11130 [Melipona quadrifasciata]|uniref:Uncharacterized protein n=1 Tax=Melipona quadrifasciata TaxID=166423 RepID=A0A0M9A6A4_9HYME|nr:hypothetical protein WN51_11130 [Melipona quadrifasciata]
MAISNQTTEFQVHPTAAQNQQDPGSLIQWRECAFTNASAKALQPWRIIVCGESRIPFAKAAVDHFIPGQKGSTPSLPGQMKLERSVYRFLPTLAAQPFGGIGEIAKFHFTKRKKRIFICRNDCSNNKNVGVGQAISFDIALDISNLEESAQPVLEGSGRRMGRIVMRFGKGSAKSSTYPRTPEVALGATKRYDQALLSRAKTRLSQIFKLHGMARCEQGRQGPTGSPRPLYSHPRTILIPPTVDSTWEEAERGTSFSFCVLAPVPFPQSVREIGFQEEVISSSKEVQCPNGGVPNEVYVRNKSSSEMARSVGEYLDKFAKIEIELNGFLQYSSWVRNRNLFLAARNLVFLAIEKARNFSRSIQHRKSTPNLRKLRARALYRPIHRSQTQTLAFPTLSNSKTLDDCNASVHPTDEPIRNNKYHTNGIHLITTDKPRFFSRISAHTYRTLNSGTGLEFDNCSRDLEDQHRTDYSSNRSLGDVAVLGNSVWVKFGVKVLSEGNPENWASGSMSQVLPALNKAAKKIYIGIPPRLTVTSIAGYRASLNRIIKNLKNMCLDLNDFLYKNTQTETLCPLRKVSSRNQQPSQIEPLRLVPTHDADAIILKSNHVNTQYRKAVQHRGPMIQEAVQVDDVRIQLFGKDSRWSWLNANEGEAEVNDRAKLPFLARDKHGTSDYASLKEKFVKSRGTQLGEHRHPATLDLVSSAIAINFSQDVKKIRLRRRSYECVNFITQSDFGGDNSENRASSGATLMQRKLAIVIHSHERSHIERQLDEKYCYSGLEYARILAQACQTSLALQCQFPIRVANVRILMEIAVFLYEKNTLYSTMLRRSISEERTAQETRTNSWPTGNDEPKGIAKENKLGLDLKRLQYTKDKSQSWNHSTFVSQTFFDKCYEDSSNNMECVMRQDVACTPRFFVFSTYFEISFLLSLKMDILELTFATLDILTSCSKWKSVHFFENCKNSRVRADRYQECYWLLRRHCITTWKKKLHDLYLRDSTEDTRNGFLAYFIYSVQRVLYFIHNMDMKIHNLPHRALRNANVLRMAQANYQHQSYI